MAAHAYWRLRLKSPTAGAGAFAGSEITMAQSSGGTNECTGGSSFSTQAFGGDPGSFDSSHMFDGNTTNIWSSTDAAWGQNIGYHFASAVDIVEVSWQARNDSFYTQSPIAFTVEYSDNGTDYFLAWAVRNVAWVSASQVQTWLKPSGTGLDDHSYWNIEIYNDAHPTAGFGPCCSEIEFRATISGSDQATGGTAFSDTDFNGSFNHDKAFDNDTTTYWSSSSGKNFPQCIGYQFTGDVFVEEVALTSQNNSDYLQTPSDFYVCWSDDGIVYVPYWEDTATWTAATQTKTFSPDLPASVDYTLPDITLTAPTAAATVVLNLAYTLPTVTLTAPAFEAHGGTHVTYALPDITLTPPNMTVAQVTQVVLGAVGVPTNDAQVTYAGENVLALINNDARVTTMALLVLAKGGDIPLVPDPLSLHDMGREPVLRQRLVNMYVEPTPQGPAKSAHYQRPGLYTVAQRGGGPGRCTFLFRGFRIMVSGGSVWRDALNIGTIPDDAKTRFAVSDEECVLVAGGRAWYVTLDDVTQITDPDLPRVRDVLQIAGRFIYIHADTNGEYSFSDVNDAQSIDGLSFASAESSPDPLVGGIILGDNIFLAGTRTVEWHYPVDDIDAPFQRSKGRRYDKGCPAIMSLRLADNSGFFVGHDRIVYRTDQVPRRVSNYDVEDSLRRVTDAELSNITAWVLTYGGHTFYIMNLPGQGTWALDIGQGLWARWLTHKKDRFRIDFSDDNFLCDHYTGHIMGMDGGYFTDFSTDSDGTDPIERICSTYAPLPAGVLTNFNLSLFCTRGVGIVGNPGDYGVEPVVEMRFTDGESGGWTSWMEAPLGAAGDHSKGALAIWTQLGMVSSPGRLFEFRCSDPVFFAPYAVRMNEQVS